MEEVGFSLLHPVLLLVLKSECQPLLCPVRLPLDGFVLVGITPAWYGLCIYGSLEKKETHIFTGKQRSKVKKSLCWSQVPGSHCSFQGQGSSRCPILS